MLFAKKYDWIKIAASPDDIAGLDKGIAELQVAGKQICITAYKGSYYAFSSHCPHAGGPLAMGELDQKGRIRCPLHGYMFSIRNGFNASGEGYHLPCWPIEQRTDGVYIGFRKTDE